MLRELLSKDPKEMVTAFLSVRRVCPRGAHLSLHVSLSVHFREDEAFGPVGHPVPTGTPLYLCRVVGKGPLSGMTDPGAVSKLKSFCTRLGSLVSKPFCRCCFWIEPWWSRRNLRRLKSEISVPCSAKLCTPRVRIELKYSFRGKHFTEIKTCVEKGETGKSL